MMTLFSLMVSLLIHKCLGSSLLMLWVMWFSMSALVLELSLNYNFYLVNSSFSKLIEWDSISSVLVILSIFITLMMALNAISQSSCFYLWLQFLLLVILVLAFSFKQLILFYLSFEISLIPIMLIIMGWGYQPERFLATIYMMVYTVVGSMPLLLLILMMMKFSDVNNFLTLKWELSMGLSGSLLIYELMMIFLNLGFLVKFPMYGFHFWLPKAHVEAPVEGSMILAGLLLKLGGFGMILMSPLVSSSILTHSLCSFSLWGGGAISLLCLRITDMKMLIAYSSVAHMSLAISCILMQTKVLILGSLLIMVSHGITSPGMFLGSFYVYKWTNSRNLLLSSALMMSAQTFSMWWFILCVANMAGPPSVNLIGEVVSIMGVFSVSMAFSIQLGLMIFLVGAYTLILYVTTQHSQKIMLNSLKTSMFLKDQFVFFFLTFPSYTMVFMMMFLMI